MTYLDGNHEEPISLQELLGVDGKDTCLVRLGNIHKDSVNHANQHTICLWVTSILNIQKGAEFKTTTSGSGIRMPESVSPQVATVMRSLVVSCGCGLCVQR